MATTIVDPITTAYNADGQNFYSIEFPGVNLYQNHIATVSKANPAVVTTSTTRTISTTGTVGTIAGSGPYTAVISGMTTTEGLLTGQTITATAGTGNLGVGSTYVSSIIGNDSIGITSSATQNAGTITNIKIAAPYTTTGLADGDAILITDVGGMTQLATAGANGTNLFYANVLTSTTFSLHTNSSLSSNVNSSSFSTATANTGSYQTFTGAEYVSLGSTVPVLFPTLQTDVGTGISLDAETGEITLAADITYQILVKAYPGTSPASQGGTYYIYDESNASIVGPSAPIGSTLIATVTPSTETVYQVIAEAPNGEVWLPPASIEGATISIQAISGYSVA